MSTAGLVRSLPEIVRRGIQAALAGKHSALPGKVEAYDAATRLADVRIMVQHPVFDDDGRLDHYEDLGVLVGVPVKMPRAGGFLFSLPIAAGDEGEIVFHSTPIGEWRASGDVGRPVDASRHDIGWPTFRPDLFNDQNPLASSDLANREAGILIGKEGSSEQILIQAGVIKIGRDATDFAALAGKTATELSKISTNLTTLNAYVNGIAPGTVSPTDAYSTPGSVANALVKLGP